MLKLLGVMGISAGIAGSLQYWWNGKCRLLNFLDGYVELLSAGRRELTEEKRKTSDFFREYSSENRIIGEGTRYIAESIRLHTYGTGIEMWKECWDNHLTEEGIGRDVILEVNKTGKAFFGKNPEENEKLFRLYENRFRDLYEREEGRSKEQKKLVFPVGALAGLMLIVILI